MRSASRLLLLLLLVLTASSCAQRYTRVKVHDSGGITVKLRSERGVDRGYRHPTVISGARIAHILSFVDVRSENGDRRAAFDTENIYEVGEALSRAFAKAEPHQELAVQVIRVDRKMGLFTDKYLTSFVSYIEGDQLVVRLSRVNWQIPKAKEDELPEPFPGKRVQNFRVIASDHIAPLGVQGITAHWKDERFRKASTLRFDPTGRLRRKTVLLEGEVDDLEDSETELPVLPSGLSPEQLRDLADLEEERRAGTLAEAEYFRRRREILETAAGTDD